MIKINLGFFNSKDKRLTASISGTLLTVGGVGYELSELADGSSADHPVLRNLTRHGDDYELTLTSGHADNAPESHRFPAPIIITDNEWEFSYDQLVSTRV